MSIRDLFTTKEYSTITSESCFMISDNYKDFMFTHTRNVGKSLFLCKFTLVESLDNNHNSLYVIKNKNYTNIINDRIFSFLDKLNITYKVVENRKYDKITFKNGTNIKITTKLDYQDYDNIIIDDAEYFFWDKLEDDWKFKYIVNNYDKRLIMSSSFNGGLPIHPPYTKDKYYNNIIDIMDKYNIPIFNLSEEEWKIKERSFKINKIKNIIKNH